ncbi:hypothetical protein CH263_20235 [Rhodococcus sp. 06-1059B-a]|nr:hypothetical protein [Rhodococcus sp. 06-1059B-a]OZD60821.1 hypothetical protein CH263_20235 [Rhodococcus sp. 06-1059B-a]
MWIGIFHSDDRDLPARPHVEAFEWARGRATTSDGVPIGEALRAYDFGDREDQLLELLLAADSRTSFASRARRRLPGRPDQIVHIYAHRSAENVDSIFRAGSLAFVVIDVTPEPEELALPGRSLSQIIADAITDRSTFRCVVDQQTGELLRWHGVLPTVLRRSFSDDDRVDWIHPVDAKVILNHAQPIDSPVAARLRIHDGTYKRFAVWTSKIVVGKRSIAMVLSFSPV